FAGSSYYNVYYNYDGLFGIYALPAEGTAEYRAIKRGSLNNTDIPADLLVHTFHFFAFSMDNFYGLKDIMNVDTYYDLLYTRTNQLLNPNAEGFDPEVARILLKEIDEPHTSYGFPSYFNKSTFEVSGLNNLASYGSRFQKWYYDGMIDTDNVIGAKWGQASGNAWNASRRPAYWFLDDEKTSVVITFDGFSTQDLYEADNFDEEIIANVMKLDSATGLLPNVEGDKFFFINSSTTSDRILEVLVKGQDASFLEKYATALETAGYSLVKQDTTDNNKKPGYYTKSYDGKNYMVQIRFEAAYDLFYVSISSKVPTSYTVGWSVTPNVIDLVDGDSAIYFEVVLDQIFKESPDVEYVLVDLSWNTGGNVGALYRVIGFITDQPFRTTSIDADTGSKSSSYVRIDGVPYYPQLKWGIIITPTTFSAANSMATIFVENNLGPVIGKVSGGGAASITPILLPSGTAFTMSSTNLSAYRTGAGTEEDPYVYHHNEFG